MERATQTPTPLIVFGATGDLSEKKFLPAIFTAFGECSNKLFYLAVPPVHYETIFQKLNRTGLTVPSSVAKKPELHRPNLIDAPPPIRRPLR